MRKAKNLEKVVKRQRRKKNELGLIPLILYAYFGLSFLIIWISYIKIFSKAGQSWWKAFIPLFNLIYFYKNCRKTSMVYYLISYPTNWIFVIGFSDCKIIWENIIFSIGLIILPIVFSHCWLLEKSEYKKKNQ